MGELGLGVFVVCGFTFWAASRCAVPGSHSGHCSFNATKIGRAMNDVGYGRNTKKVLEYSTCQPNMGIV